MGQSQFLPTSLTRRRFLQYSGGLAMSGSLLAACAGTGTTPAGNTSTNNGPALTQWYHVYGEKGTHEAVLKYAKDYTKARVNVSWVPGVGDEYASKVRAALLGSSAPDVFELPGPTVDQVKAGLIAPLDDIIDSVKSDFLPASLKPLTINGHVYAIKMINDPVFVYYRKSMFQKANITDTPKTIDEFISAAKKLTSGTVKGIYIGPDGGIDAFHQIAGWASGGDFISDDKKIIFNTDRMAAAYEKLHVLYTSGALLPDAPDFWWNSAPFKNGSVAMQWCGLWAMPEIKAALGDDFGIFPFPALDAQSKPATVDGGWAEMVSAKSKNVDAAKAYVKSLWIENATVQKDWNVAYGFHVPPRVSISAETDKLKTAPASDAVDILNKYGHSMTPYWDATMDAALIEAVTNIIKKGAKGKTELDKAADKCNTELQKLV